MSATASAACPRHPGVAAQYTCDRCQSPCCLNCCYSMPDGSICCTSCYSQPESSAAATPSVSTFQGPATSTPGRGCPQHPLLPPVAFCKTCGKGSCVTCDFFFPPNLHLCPVCVATAHTKLTPQRKKYMVTGFVMAAVASLAIVIMMSGALASIVDNPIAIIVLGAIMIFLVAVPAAIGSGVAWAAYRPGGPNSIGIWISMIWNLLLLGAVVLLLIINALN